MGARLPRTFRLFAALMLAVIGLQATPAQPLPTQQSHGSAFSADTHELALPVRKEAASEVALPAIVPVLPPQTWAAKIRPRLAVAEPKGAHHQTDPPLRPEPLRRSPAPRAPPATS